MTDTPRYATARDYLAVLRRRRLLVIAITVLFALAAYLHAHGQTKMYSAEARIQFHDPTINLNAFAAYLPADVAPDQRAAIHASNIYGIQVATRAAADLGLPAAAAPSILSEVSTRAEARTDFVVVTATSKQAGDAARIANAYANAARDQSTADLRATFTQAAAAITAQIKAIGNSPVAQPEKVALEVQQQQYEQSAAITQAASVVGHAFPPGSPSSPNPTRDGVIGLLAGLTLSVLIAFLLDALDRRYRNVDDVTSDLKLPVLGIVRDRALGGTGLVEGGERPMQAEDLEAFRIMRTNIGFMDIDKPKKIVLIASGLAGEGKSTVAAGLAATEAQLGRQTLLLECDLRRPTLGKRLHLSERPGLSDHLLGGEDPRQTVQLNVHSPISRNGGSSAADDRVSFDCIVAGTETPQPAELLGSERFASFLREVAEHYEVVVIDTSPLLAVADAAELVPYADVVVLCVRVSKTRRDQARAAAGVLSRFPETTVGLVLTGLRPRLDQDDYPAYSYIHRYSRESAGVGS